ncbi:hypothetical protein [Prochlorococcus sp. MIT 1307]|uniref:hypothetical protein n=1 Tax=Prochlorococcus sp. MIT 1307 TaxID=3096219 RepID=UPI002A764D31|nr:hypothetical protein [Prochlorococcus sp. MIT 1307]
MKLIKIAALAITICCTACVSPSGNQTEESLNPSTQDEFSSQLELIESAFQKGNSKEACDLHAKVSKNLDFSKEISRGSIEELKRFQSKCMKALSKDFKELLKE